MEEKDKREKKKKEESQNFENMLKSHLEKVIEEVLHEKEEKEIPKERNLSIVQPRKVL